MWTFVHILINFWFFQPIAWSRIFYCGKKLYPATLGTMKVFAMVYVPVETLVLASGAADVPIPAVSGLSLTPRWPSPGFSGDEVWP